MTDTPPSKVVSIDIPSEIGDDTAEVTDVTTCVTDGDTVVSCNSALVIKIGKSPDDALRIEFTEDKANLAVGDTISLFLPMIHNFVDGQLLPYTDANSVTKTGQINVIGLSSVAFNVFTITQAFLDQLGDLGSGSWACRFSEKDSYLAGDTTISELEGHLTTGAAAIIRIANEILDLPEGTVTTRALIRLKSEILDLPEARNFTRALIRLKSEILDLVEGAIALPVGAVIIKVSDEILDLVEGTVITRALIRLKAEIVDLAEVANLVKAFSKVNPETLDLSESTASTRALIRLKSEILDLAEAANPLRAFSKVKDEILDLVEGGLNVLGIVKEKGEILDLPEGSVAQKGIVQLIAEQLDIIGPSEKPQLNETRGAGTRNALSGDLPWNTLRDSLPAGRKILAVDFSYAIDQGTVSRCAIYDNNLDKIGESDEISRTLGVNHFPFSTPVIVPNDGLVVVAFFSDAAQNFHLQSGGAVGNLVLDQANTYPTFPDPLALDVTVSSVTSLWREIFTDGGEALPLLTLVRLKSEILDLVEGTVIIRGLIRLKAEVLDLVEGALNILAKTRVNDETLDLSEGSLAHRARVFLKSEILDLVEGALNVLGIAKDVSEILDLPEDKVTVKGIVIIGKGTEILFSNFQDKDSDKSAAFVAGDAYRQDGEFIPVNEGDVILSAFCGADFNSVFNDATVFRLGLYDDSNNLLATSDEQIMSGDLRTYEALFPSPVTIGAGVTSVYVAVIADDRIILRSVIRTPPSILEDATTYPTFPDPYVSDGVDKSSRNLPTAIRRESQFAQLGLSEATVLTRARIFLKDEILDLPEARNFIRGIVILKAEILDLVEASLKILGLTRVDNEILDLPEAANPLRPLKRVTAEILDLVEATVFTRALIRLKAETVNLVEGAVNVLGIVRVKTEILDLVESALNVLGIVRAKNEILEFVESAVSKVIISKVVSDILNLVESAISKFRVVFVKKAIKARAFAKGTKAIILNKGTKARLVSEN